MAVTDLIRRAYAENERAGGPIAYLDETFDVDTAHPLNFYAVSAVIVDASEREPLLQGLVSQVGSTYWHSTEQMRTEAGRER